MTTQLIACLIIYTSKKTLDIDSKLILQVTFTGNLDRAI